MLSSPHGPRISAEEYDRRIVGLYEGLPPRPPKEDQLRVRREELNIAIDRRLGTQFPEDRRRQLWEIQQRIEYRRLWHGLLAIFRLARSRASKTRGRHLVGFLQREYAKVLSPDEMNEFFSDDDRRSS